MGAIVLGLAAIVSGALAGVILWPVIGWGAIPAAPMAGSVGAALVAAFISYWNRKED